MQVWILLLFTLPFSVFAAGDSPQLPGASAPVTGEAAKTVGEAALNDQAREAEKRELLIEKQGKHPPETIERQQKRAAALASQAHEYFSQGEYRKAAKPYYRAMSLDATVDQYYYEYGIIVYKLGFFQKALAILNMMEGTDVNQTELDYYQALCLYSLKNDDGALAKFKHTEEANDQVLSPLAAMYAGMIDKSHERFNSAKKHFDYVLEFSKDPELDKKADAQIDDILHSQQTLARGKKKWGFAAYVGAAYDSNVLNAAQVNAASNIAAYRLLYGGGVNYKAVYNSRNSFVPQLWASDMYSVNTRFKSDSAAQAADPFQAELSMPYRHFFKSGTLTLSPAYQTLVMSLDQGNRDLVYDAEALAVMYTLTYGSRWIANYRLDVAKEKFDIKNTAAIDDQSALKYTILASHTRLLNDGGSKTLVIDALYSHDDTTGDNFRYNKFLGGIGGTFPVNSSNKLLAYVRGDYFTLNFPDNTVSRKDTGIVGSIGAGYTFSDRTSTTLNFQYYDNSSNVAAYDYHKYALTLIYSFNNGF